jgi:hypothetical protein
MNKLYVRYGRKWDLVANGGTPEALAEFAQHFPGRRWKVCSPDGELLSGRAPAKPQADAEPTSTATADKETV